jgi:hypothetical protein
LQYEHGSLSGVVTGILHGKELNASPGIQPDKGAVRKLQLQWATSHIDPVPWKNRGVHRGSNAILFPLPLYRGRIHQVTDSCGNGGVAVRGFGVVCEAG